MTTREYATTTRRLAPDDGFSLLEIVVAVSIMLILAVVGFIAYQGFTDNARQAAVEQAASDVFTAANAAVALPTSATDQDRGTGVQLASYRMSTVSTNAEIYARLRDIEADYNDNSGDDLHVNVDYYHGELTVTALGWDNKYSAMRSTDAEIDGTVETPRGEPIDDTTGGVFRFTTGAPHSSVYLSDFGADGVTLQFGDGPAERIQPGVVALPTRGEYTVRGEFGSIGDANTTTDIIEVSIWENTNTLDASYAFDGTRSDIIFHDTPANTIQNMYNMFNDAVRFNQDVSDWDMTNVTSTRAMFHGATRFNNGGKPLDWGDDFRNVVDMASMFDDTDYFDQDVSSWNVSGVENAAQMFNNAFSFNNGGKPLDWNEHTANFTNTSRMFYHAHSFNQDISGWELGNVTNMMGMFWDARSFDQDISDWDVSNVTNMDRMFQNATVYNNGGKPLDWGTKTRKVELMSWMFHSAAAFNQDLSGWDVSSVRDSRNFDGSSPLAVEHRPRF